MLGRKFKTLNLAYPEQSDIKFHISKFPDGQQTIDINDVEHLNSENIKIYSRIRSFRDLEIIIGANQILRTAAVASVSLYVPYFLGARSDRRFKKGGINYLKNVIAPIINSQNFNEVRIMDPHSDVLEACINNFVKSTNYSVTKMALDDIGVSEVKQSVDNICLVSPDAGAYKKVFDVAKWFGINDIITASKVRDVATGKILRTEVPSIKNHTDSMKYVIVDDICDGGRTFIELAKVIKEQNPIAKIYLVVTHGIFSAGFGELNNYFERIYTTNSIKEHDNSQVKQLNIF